METKRTVGNRRTEEELEQLRIQSNKLSFELEEQEDFKGTPEQLELMQMFERAYIDGAPLISDEEWDIMKVKFNYQESLTSTSPSGRSWVKLFSPLPSINKATNLDELKAFLDKFDEGQMFKIELKGDGLTANVRYKLNESTGLYEEHCVTSRGNGRYGLRLHDAALYGVNVNWPKTIEPSYVLDVLGLTEGSKPPKYFELRGEAMIPKNEFTYAKYGETPVWRSIAAGMFNRKVPFNLRGVIQYLYGEERTNEILDTPGPIILKGADARLVASLSNGKDPNKFLRNDEVHVWLRLNKIFIMHASGEVFTFYDEGEQIDIVFYSTSIKDSNIDTDKIANIPGVKYISQIELEESQKGKLENQKNLYLVTSDRNQIIQAVCDFYGTDLNGKRDFSKPRLRNLCEYALDGIVIKPIDSNRETQGMFFRNHKNNASKIVCPKYPEDQIAVKLLSEVIKVKLERIEKNRTDLENVTCSGVLDKTYKTESGAEVSRINLHNEEWLAANSWIQEGQEYEMIMSMDIIPVFLNPNL